MAAKSRRWYQFSILAALILTTIVAVLVAMFVVPAQRQRAAVARILAAGGQVTYEHEVTRPIIGSARPSPPGPALLHTVIGPDYFQTVIGVSIFDKEQRPEEVAEALTAAAQLPKLEWVHIDCPAFSRVHVAQMAQLRTLQYFHIVQPIAGSDIETLARLRNLHEMSFAGDFTGTELAPLRSLTELKRLMIRGTITSDGLDLIAELKQLQRLVLHCPVADADVPKLASLTMLRQLYCTTGRVTRALAEISQIECKDSSPQSIIDYLAERHEIKSRFDDAAISAVGIELERVVISATYSGMLDQLLDQILTHEGLGYRIQDDVLVITSLEEAQRAHAGINELRRRLPNLSAEVRW